PRRLRREDLRRLHPEEGCGQVTPLWQAFCKSGGRVGPPLFVGRQEVSHLAREESLQFVGQRVPVGAASHQADLWKLEPLNLIAESERLVGEIDRCGGAKRTVLFS